MVTTLDVPAAARRLAEGGLVAFPTETVYGLGARADDDAAVAAIFAAKGRPADHPLIVHVADAASARHFVAPAGAPVQGEALHLAERLIERFWPGPLTLVLPRRAGVAAAAAGGQPSIGLRLPAHPLARELLAACRALGVPGLAAPSANRFGRISPTTAAHVLSEFDGRVPVLDGGPCAVGIESTIVDLTRGRPVLLRPGRLGRAEIEAVLGQALAERDAEAPRASGTLEAHYAPDAPLRLLPRAAMAPAALAAAVHTAKAALGGPATALAVYSRACLPEPLPAGVVWRQMPDDAAAAAHELFAVLREFDAAGARQIWVETPPESPDWEGVRDRLTRAAAGAGRE